MKKQYIDFAPVKKTSQRTASGNSSVRRNGQVFSAQQTSPTKQVRKTTKVAGSGKISRNAAIAKEVSFSGGPKLGVLEETTSRFVKTVVDKRPLSGGGAAQSVAVGVDAADLIKQRQDGNAKLWAAKAIKVKNRTKKTAKTADNGVANSARVKKEANTGYNIPKSPFINQANLSKRPLSKNVYRKPEEITSEFASSTNAVAIVSQPQKESKWRMVIGIIVTAILGAAAGAVAFLLLPK